MARRIGTRGVAWVATALASFATLPDAVADDARITVTRDPGADDCPGEAAFVETLAVIRGNAGPGRGEYRVEFRRNAGGFTVTVRTEPSGRARTLESKDATCAALGRAAAVTLALLLDAAPEEVPVRAPIPSELPVPPRERPARRAARVDTEASLGGTGLAGVVGPLAVGVRGELGISTARFRAGLGALWVPPRSLSFGPGEVREALAVGTARLCYAPFRTDGTRIDACTGAFAGVLAAEGAGYTRDERSARPWLGVPFEVEGTLFTGQVGFVLSLGALLPVRRSDVGIDGLGVAYSSPRVAGIATIGLFGVGPGWP